MISLSDLKVKLNGSFSNSLQVKLSGSFSGGGGGYLADSQTYFDYIDGYRSVLAQPAMTDGAKQIIDDCIRLFKGQSESFGTITAVDATVVPCGSDYFSSLINLTFLQGVANVGAGTVWRSFVGMEGGSPTIAPSTDASSFQSVGTPTWNARLNGTNQYLYANYSGMVGDFDGLGWSQVYIGDKTTTYSYQDRIWAVGISGGFSDGTVNGYVYRTISSNRVQIVRAGQNREFDDEGSVVLNFLSPNTYYVTTGADFNVRTWSTGLTSNCSPNIAVIGGTTQPAAAANPFPYIWATFLNGMGSSQSEMQNIFKLFKATQTALAAL